MDEVAGDVNSGQERQPPKVEKGSEGSDREEEAGEGIKWPF